MLVCRERPSTGSVEATRKAKSLLQWIELGVTDEGELSSLIREDIVITR
jgi:hypothetical protein